MDDEAVAWRSSSGQAFSFRSSKRWDAIKAINVEDGFEELLHSVGRKQDRFRGLDPDLDGEVTSSRHGSMAAKLSSLAGMRDFVDCFLVARLVDFRLHRLVTMRQTLS
ncbi:hypothetical protein [Synechococcus sp. MIT S1220]|uniref:hypothetical protein n=1 Tax=Synechococcus sp. MIT S1220 TaxID=3082549 RepID=UPI0039AF8BA7